MADVERTIDRTMQSYVHWLWNETEDLNVLHPNNWTALARRVFDKYTVAVLVAVKDKGWNGKYLGKYEGNIDANFGEDDYDENDLDKMRQSLQWSFEGALLYSITVITTIGNLLSMPQYK
jgi:hypothetical protein